MDVTTLQGRPLARLVEDLKGFLVTGEAASQAFAPLDAAPTAGLWTSVGDRSYASPELVKLANSLPSYAEVVPAVFALAPELRKAWQRIILARMQEIGDRNDTAGLCDVVTTAGSLAAEVLADVSPSLAPTGFAELERLLLPSAAHEAPAFPVLLRVLAATAELCAAPPSSRAAPTETVWNDPSLTWRPGRLIRLPATDDTAASSVVLTGAIDDRAGDGDALRWVLHRPWMFLLGQIAFTQEAWAAERVSGSLALELDSSNVAQFDHPPRVEIVVTQATGAEIRCGSLGEFVLQVLAQLGVVIFAHRITPAILDACLANVVEALVRRNIWQFDHGSGGRHAGYAIHPSFSDACYRALGSRAFYRLGSAVTAAIRRVAENWAKDRIARAGGVAGQLDGQP